MWIEALSLYFLHPLHPLLKSFISYSCRFISFFYSSFFTLFHFPFILSYSSFRFFLLVSLTSLDVTNSFDVSGLVVFYTIKTSWKSYRSATSLQYSDIKKFHDTLEIILEEKNKQIYDRIPIFPDSKLFHSAPKVSDSEGDLWWNRIIVVVFLVWFSILVLIIEDVFITLYVSWIASYIVFYSHLSYLKITFRVKIGIF